MIKQRLIKDFIEESIKKYWDKTAYTDMGNDDYKYSQVAAYIARMHILFDKLGVKKGDKIALIGKNSSTWTMTYLSVITYGAVIVPILPDFHPREVHFVVNHSESILLLSASSKWKELDINEMQGLKAVFTIDPLGLVESRYEHDISDILARVEQEFTAKYPQDLQKDDVNYIDIPNSELVEISYTSGSTGLSKGVMLPANSLAANIDFANRHMELNPGDVIVSILPLAHSFGCAFEFLWPFNRGTNVVFLTRKPSPQVLLGAYQQYKPHLILSVPLVFEKIYKSKVLPAIQSQPVKSLLKIPGVRNLIYSKIRRGLIDALGGRFREVVLGGAPLNYEVDKFFRKIRFPYTVGYGMTECGPLISYAGWKETKFRSAGKLVDTLEAKIEWQEDKEGEVGEICVRGENVMLGYYKNEQATKQTIDEEGWLHTGDLGYIDDENFVFIKGRAKSLLLGPSGENIFPEEIEYMYQNKPYVAEILVVMRDNFRLVAMIYPDHEQMEKDNVSMEQIKVMFEQYRQEINKLLPRFKQISSIEIRDEEFEKTPKRNIRRFLYE